ncbi:MAG: TetR/AcrR family transcriptional regulator [Herpetosiphon sp.]
MARTLNEKEHADRRNDFLDAAQRLVFSKGYEQMTVQDILDDVDSSKGAFYHYFDSKPALLGALVERMLDEVERLFLPIVRDPYLPALAKLEQFFDTIARWKSSQRGLLLALLRVWYTDENAIVRQKVHMTMVKRVSIPLSEIVQQGIEEGVLTMASPQEAGGILLALLQGLQDTVAALFLAEQAKDVVLANMESTIVAYTAALERVLGAPVGSLRLVDRATLKEWVE